MSEWQMAQARACDEYLEPGERHAPAAGAVPGGGRAARGQSAELLAACAALQAPLVTRAQAGGDCAVAIEPGDTTWGLIAGHGGDPRRWQALAVYNPDIADLERIFPGQTLKLCDDALTAEEEAREVEAVLALVLDRHAAYAAERDARAARVAELDAQRDAARGTAATLRAEAARLDADIAAQEAMTEDAHDTTCSGRDTRGEPWWKAAVVEPVDPHACLGGELFRKGRQGDLAELRGRRAALVEAAEAAEALADALQATQGELTLDLEVLAGRETALAREAAALERRLGALAAEMGGRR